MNSIFEKFSFHSKSALKSAMSLARKVDSEMVEPKHILYGILEEKGSLGHEILKQSNIKPEAVLQMVKRRDELRSADKKRLEKLKDEKGEGIETSKLLSFDGSKLLEKATSIASIHNHRYVGTEHLLSGLIECGNEAVEDFFSDYNINVSQIKEKISMVLKSTSKFPDLTNAIDSVKGKDDDLYPLENRPMQTNTASRGNVLEFYGTNLTDEKIQNNIDPVIGREEEITRLVQILSRRTKNNPLLLGDPGVGKTAIVEGLAKRIITGDVPEILLNKIIYTLDLGLIIAGSSFRGEFESRLKNVISEIKQNPNIILFIDEIHNIIGAGSATGSMDAANILKPSLARGEIRCIGATTMEEYKKYIENDLALERRFQPIIVHQPSVEKSIEILKGIRENYEKYHRVKITDDAIEAACQLSQRYIQEKFLPDKAIDLIDEAAAAFRIKNQISGKVKKIKGIENEMRALQSLKERAVFAENFDLALEFRQKEEKLKNQRQKLNTQQLEQSQKTLGQIDQKDIMRVISKIARVPLEELLTREKNTLLNLEKRLSRRIVGQNHAVSAISECIRRSKAGISDGDRPLGSFIFLGPSGVGKTELAKVLAENVFGGQESLIRIDMSEFSESFNISKLIGSPAGYVGYKDSTKLTDMVRKKPYSVVLFDEIEKAHPQIFNIMLQILEDGHLTDAAGKMINFKNTIVIMTSNIGSQEFSKLQSLGFESNSQKDFSDTKREILKKLGDYFKNEFLNRIDKVVIFNPLANTDLSKIASLQLKDLEQRLMEKNITLVYDAKIVRHIGKLSYSTDQGARLIRKNILEMIESPIAAKVLAGMPQEEALRNIHIKISGDKIILE